MTYHDKIEKLSLDFYKGTYDWINFRIFIGDRSIRTRFWAYADPLPNLKCWLEAICIGVRECAFSFDAEGDDLKFVFEHSWRGSMFRVGDVYSTGKWLLEGRVDRAQLVREFYFGFLNHRNSPLFNKDGWETEYLWERLVRKLNVPREDLANALIPLNRHDLDNLWFDHIPADPPAIEIDFERFGIEDPNEEYKNEQLQYEIEMSEYLIIPLDYDEQTVEFKRELIEKNLDKKWNGKDGSKLIELRSEIVEKFLEQNKPVQEIPELESAISPEGSDDSILY